ncbi:MAG: acetamidase/formamidase family protein [Acidobacteria bacterium]|nr:acetamidase/formamidase family protein [Acidobacteriota bacterium]
MKIAFVLPAALCLLPAFLSAQPIIRAVPANIQWGYYGAGVKPVLTVKSGETARIETVSGIPEMLARLGAEEDDNLRELREIYAEIKEHGPGPHILTGPVAVEGAAPGDVLQVDILEIRLRSTYGWKMFVPELGMLPDEFPYERTKLIRLDERAGVAEFGPGIRIPLRPFFGSMGVAPPSGRVNSAPPGYYTGNMDNKYLTAGTTLYMPVHHPGALFAVGDGHAAQGDGEVDLTAIETPLSALLRFTVRKDMKLRWPRAETATHVITMGFHETLDEAARRATKEMIEYLVTARGLSRDDAYMLVSAAVDLHVTQVVDGSKGVHTMLPKSIFATPPR